MTEPAVIRVLLVDDHAIVRKGLEMVLRLDPQIEIVGQAGNGQSALELAINLKPDLVLLDFVMRGMNGEETAAALRKLSPQSRILMLTGVDLDDRVLKMLAADADGYIVKNIDAEQLVEAIHTVARGEAYLHPTLARHLLKLNRAAPAPAAGVKLTRRETEVLRLMATPATYKEIAAQLFVSEETIRTHAKHILNKLEQPNRAQTVLAAVRIGLIDLPDY